MQVTVCQDPGVCTTYSLEMHTYKHCYTQSSDIIYIYGTSYLSKHNYIQLQCLCCRHFFLCIVMNLYLHFEKERMVNWLFPQI